MAEERWRAWTPRVLRRLRAFPTVPGLLVLAVVTDLSPESEPGYLAGWGLAAIALGVGSFARGRRGHASRIALAVLAVSILAHVLVEGVWFGGMVAQERNTAPFTAAGAAAVVAAVAAYLFTLRGAMARSHLAAAAFLLAYAGAVLAAAARGAAELADGGAETAFLGRSLALVALGVEIFRREPRDARPRHDSRPG